MSFIVYSGVILVVVLIAIVVGIWAVIKAWQSNSIFKKGMKYTVFGVLIAGVVFSVIMLLTYKKVGYVTGVECDYMYIDNREYRLSGRPDGYSVDDRDKCIGYVTYKKGLKPIGVYSFKGDESKTYLYRNCMCGAFFGTCTRDGAYYKLVE